MPRFIPNVTFQCSYCSGGGARRHSWRGMICPDCYYEFRFQDLVANWDYED